MTDPKTRPTTACVEDFLALQPDARRADCQALLQMMEAATGERAEMWGTSIVGFGRYAVSQGNGKTIDWPVVGFSPRKQDLTLYLMPGFAGAGRLLAKLGRHRTGKSCLYLKRLADVDLDVLRELIGGAVDGMAARRVR